MDVVIDLENVLDIIIIHVQYFINKCSWIFLIERGLMPFIYHVRFSSQLGCSLGYQSTLKSLQKQN